MLTLTIAQGYDPSLEYHDYSTVQIWMGKDKVTVGDTVGQDLYNAVYGALDRNCPARNGPSGCHGIKDANFESRCMKAWPALTVPCTSLSHAFISQETDESTKGTTNIWGISARYENNSIRQLLIAAVAGALQQMTLESIIGPTNCFDMAGIWACNVGDVVRVSSFYSRLSSYTNSESGQLSRNQGQRTKLHVHQALQLLDLVRHLGLLSGQ